MQSKNYLKSNRAMIAFAGYFLLLGIMATAGYRIYSERDASLKPKTDDSNYFQTDLSYVNLPRISLSIPSLQSNRMGNVRIELTLEVEKKYSDVIEGKMPRITDQLVAYMQNLDFERVAHPNSTDWLRPDLLQAVNAASKPTPVKDLIFRQFIVM
jgi:flagellar basal body-associated protein FliL